VLSIGTKIGDLERPWPPCAPTRAISAVADLVNVKWFQRGGYVRGELPGKRPYLVRIAFNSTAGI